MLDESYQREEFLAAIGGKLSGLAVRSKSGKMAVELIKSKIRREFPGMMRNTRLVDPSAICMPMLVPCAVCVFEFRGLAKFPVVDVRRPRVASHEHNKATCSTIT